MDDVIYGLSVHGITAVSKQPVRSLVDQLDLVDERRS